MHFTMWPSKTSPGGSYGEIEWVSFVAYVAAPAVAPSKDALEGWSPVKFAGNHRAKSNAELVSCIVLDVDKTQLVLEQVAALFHGIAGAIHTTHSHTPETPKYRVVLQCTRDMTPAEHARVWAFVRDALAARGLVLDEATKDPSRLWYMPAHAEGAVYAWAELPGQPINVDAILAPAPPAAPIVTAPATPTREATAAPLEARRKGQALALASVWPPDGQRREAHMALAGALKSEGFTEPEAVDFLCSVYRALGEDKRTAVEGVCRHTWSTEVVTGWTRLKSFVDPVVVDAARAALGRGAETKEAIGRRLAEAAAEAKVGLVPNHVRTSSGLVLRAGGWDEPLVPPSYVVDGLLVAGSVTLFVAHGSSLKSMSTISIGASVVRGKPWLAQFPTLQGPAVFMDYERNAYEMRRRVKLLRAEGLRDFYHCAQPTLRGDDERLWGDLVELKPRIVVLDSLVACALGVNENETDAAKPLSLAQRFAQATGAAVVVVHHARKGTGGDPREAVRGSTAIFAAADAVYTFEPLEAPDGVKRMRVRCTKMNLGREPAPFAIELSDERGLVLYEEPAAAAGRNAEKVEDLQAAIRLALAHGPVPGVKALARKLSKKSERVGDELTIMIERREVVKLDDGYHLDDDERRAARVVAFVERHAGDARFNTVTRLATATHVAPADVERLLLARVIERAVGRDQGGFIPGAAWPKAV